MLELCETLYTEMEDTHKKKLIMSTSRTGLLRFRLVVVTVLAVNRFLKIAVHSKTIRIVQRSICGVLFYGVVSDHSNKGMFH